MQNIRLQDLFVSFQGSFLDKYVNLENKKRAQLIQHKTTKLDLLPMSGQQCRRSN